MGTFKQIHENDFENQIPPMQVTVQALFPDDGNAITLETNAQATAQSLISSFCSQKGIPYSSNFSAFDSAKRPIPTFSTLQSVNVTDGQTIYVGYRDNYNARTLRPLYIAIVALILCIIGILAMSLTHGLSGGFIPFDYGVVMDAGSSKTNTLLYHWLGNKYRGTGRVRQIDKCLVRGGIAKSVLQEGIAKVIECTKNVTSELEKEKIPQTPLYFASTAGMRLLNMSDPDKVEALMEALNAHLNESGLSVRDISMISGRDEGIYAWITTNFLKDTLEKENTEPWTPITFGALDMGGASSQIAFELPPSDENKNNTHVQSMMLYGERHDVFSKSYLCFGRDEAQRRYQALLVKSPYVRKVDDPCAPKGFQENKTGKFLFDQPCTQTEKFKTWIQNDERILVQNYTFDGTSDYETCKKHVIQLTEPNSCSKDFDECFYKLPRPLEDQKFLGFASYFYTTHFLGLTQSSLADYENVTKYFCQKSRNEIIDDSDFAGQYCFNAVYIHRVLVDGFGFNSSTWKNLEFIGKVDGKDIGWSLGYMINATNAIPEKKPSPRLIAPAVMIICLVLFVIAVIAALVYIVRTLYRKKPIQTNDSAQSLYKSP